MKQIPSTNRAFLRPVILMIVTLLASMSLAQPGSSTVPLSVPASRQADRIAVITIEGAIDGTTAMSVRRRIKEAEEGGYQAIVFEIDSPGGGVGAVLDITNTIKSSSITNTVAWVNPDAYSGGAIIALACSEIISSSPGSMGDAFPVIMTTVGQGRNARGGLRGLTPDERTKLLPPLLADVTDSARRNGYDEYLVQAIVIDGIELWQIEDTQTLQRHAINAHEYMILFGEEPPRGMPMIAQVTGGRPTGVTDPDADGIESPNPSDAAESPADDAESEVSETDSETVSETDSETASESVSESVTPADVPADPNSFRPASDTLDDVVREFGASERAAELTLDAPSTRPLITGPSNGRYTPVAYITDGSAPIVMREQQLIDLGFSSGIIQNDTELMAFMGATSMDRADESLTERGVRFMTSMPVRGLLMVIFLIAIFVELITPGTGLGGTVAVLVLIAMIAPPAMIGLAGWWEVIAIVSGLILLAIEAFVTPGFGVFGILGLISLFGGILFSFIPAGSSLSNPSTQQDLMGAMVTVTLATFTAGVVIWLISRNLEKVPIFDRLVLAGATGIAAEGRGGSILSAMNHHEDTLRVGETGISTTDLRPSGRADINDRLIDVVAEMGYIESGTAVRVVAVESMRIVVDRVSADDADTETNSDVDNDAQENA